MKFRNTCIHCVVVLEGFLYCMFWTRLRVQVVSRCIDSSRL